MYKKLILFFMLIILSGCSAESSIIINSDESVEEKVVILDDNKSFDANENNIDRKIDYIVENYKNILDFRKYAYSNLIGKEKSGLEITKKYDNICDYFEDTAFNQYIYKSVKCNETNDYYEIYNYTNYIPYCEGCSDWPRLEEVKFSIKLPIKASESNADSIDGTTYFWKYDKNTPNNKDFYLKISKKELEKNRVKEEKRQELEKKAQQIGVILLIILSILTLIFVALKLRKKYMDNKLEY